MGQKVRARGQCLSPLSVWFAPWADALWVSSLESQELMVGLRKQTNKNKQEKQNRDKDMMLGLSPSRKWLKADFFFFKLPTNITIPLT